MPVLMILAAVAVLVGVFFAATGRGGEMSYEPADHAPLDLGPVSAAEVALLHPPTALWGYNVQVTNEALELVARAMRERDITIAYLQQQIADLALPPAVPPAVPPAEAPAAPAADTPQLARPEDRYEPDAPAADTPQPARPEDRYEPDAPAADTPQLARPEDRYEPERPLGQEPPAGQAAGEYRGQDDPTGPTAAPAAGEQDR